jgi:hypothetical protein
MGNIASYLKINKAVVAADRVQEPHSKPVLFYGKNNNSSRSPVILVRITKNITHWKYWENWAGYTSAYLSESYCIAPIKKANPLRTGVGFPYAQPYGYFFFSSSANSASNSLISTILSMTISTCDTL